MSNLLTGAEIIIGLAGIVAGVFVTWCARGSRLTSLSLSVVPVGAHIVPNRCLTLSTSKGTREERQ